jgi:hypothetical protein
MNIIGEVLKELLSMFFADARLALATLGLVAMVGGLVAVLHLDPFLAGGLLLVGCLAILVGTASHEARDRAHR